jgi:hypothetical protein
MDAALQCYQAVILDEAGEKSMRQGSPLELELGTNLETDAGIIYSRAYSVDGRLLGILRYVPEKGLWQPKKVFVQPI